MIEEIQTINSSLIISSGSIASYSFTGIFTSGSSIITDVSPSQINKLIYGTQIVASSLANNFSYTGLVLGVTDTTISTDTVYDLSASPTGLTGVYSAALPYDNIVSVSSGTKTIFNNTNRDIDFQVKSTGTSSSLYYDASTGRLGVGITGAPDAMLHIVSPCAKDGLILESRSNCITGVTLLLLHFPGNTPVVGSTPSTINLAGRDHNQNVINYAQIKSKILSKDVLNTSGEIVFSVDNTGMSKEVFVANLTNLILGANNSISGNNYNILGKENYASGISYLLIGNNNSGIQINDSISLGNNNTLSGPQLFAVTSDSYVSGTQIFSLGLNNDTVGSSGLVCGINSNTTGSYNVLLLNNSDVLAQSLLGLLKDSSISGNSGILLGSDIYSTGNKIIGIGFNNSVTGNNSNIIGSDSYVYGNSNIVFGNDIYISGNSIISLGSNQDIASITNGILIGNDVNFDSTSNIVYLGFDNTTSDGLNNSVVIGGKNKLNNGNLSHLILLGQNNITQDMENSVLIGNSNNLSGIIVNNIIFGSGNAMVADSYNNIVLGTLNNQTGVQINSQGEVTGVPKPINVDNINSINIGIHNKTFLNNSNINIGNKNIVSGININSVGSFNNLRNCNSSYIVGNSNYIEGDNVSTIGKYAFVLGDDSIVINNQSNSVNSYGSGVISIGNNYHIPSGNIIVGYNNRPGISGLVYGKNNNIGFARDFFIFNTGTNDSNIIRINRVDPPYQIGDRVLLHIRNPVLKNSTKQIQITNISPNVNNGTTDISFGEYITANLQMNRYFEINDMFDDNNTFTPNGSGNGIMIALANNDTSPIYYGANDIVIGDKNAVVYSDSIVIGNNNVASGYNNVIIGNNIINTGNNTVNIGSSNTNKVIIDDSKIIFNSGTAQTAIITKSISGTYASYHDLSTSRLGINTEFPRSELDVSGTVTAQTFRMGLSSTSGFVMTANNNGIGSWVLPVNLSGSNNSLLAKITDKVASGISDLSIMTRPDFDAQSSTSLSFYNGNFEIHKTGIVLNALKGNGVGNDAVNFTIFGGGGSLNPPILDIDADSRIAQFSNMSSFSGMIGQLNITSGIKLPSISSGTILSMSGDRSLIGRTVSPYGILFSNSSSVATGNKYFRWFDDNGSGILAIGGGTEVIGDSFSAANYNIVLSSDPNADTVFNRFGMKSNLSVIGSGQLSDNGLLGFHILNSNRSVGVNTSLATLTSVSSDDTKNIKLFVNGTVAAKRFAIENLDGLYPTVGYYLRVGPGGIVTPQAGSIDGAFSATYPLVNFAAQDGSQSYKIATTPSNSQDNFAINEGWGRTLVLGQGGNSWVVGSGLNIWQKNGSPTTAGMLVGYGGSLGNVSNIPSPGYHYVNTFAGGSFAGIGTKGTSQYSQFFLRTRTNDDTVTSMTMDWTVDDQTGASANNTMTFPLNVRGVWAFTAYVNMMGHYTGNKTVSGVAGAYIINGAISCLDGSQTLSLMGTGVQKFSTGSVSHDVKIDVSTGVFDIQVSGVDNMDMIWSATVNINQTHWPQNDLLSTNIN